MPDPVLFEPRVAVALAWHLWPARKLPHARQQQTVAQVGGVVAGGEGRLARRVVHVQVVAVQVLTVALEPALGDWTDEAKRQYWRL